jgi:DNA polymerase sigma
MISSWLHMNTLLTSSRLQMNTLLRHVRKVPGSHAVLFGSLPAGLSLPDSDIDVVILQV